MPRQSTLPVNGDPMTAERPFYCILAVFLLVSVAFVADIYTGYTLSRMIREALHGLAH
jgi:hypothetical protein